MHNTTDLYEETAEDIRQEKRYNFFRKILKPISAAFVVCVVTSLIFVFFNYSKNKKIEESGSKYYQLQGYESNTFLEKEARISKLMQDIVEGGGSYAGLGLLHGADLASSVQNKELALDIYERIIEDTNLEKIIRDIAFMRYTAISLNSFEGTNPEPLLEKIDNYLADSSSFKYLVLEMKAYLFLKAGYREDAIEVMQSIIASEDVPENIAFRCKSIVNVI